MDELKEINDQIESKMSKVVETVLHNSKLSASPVNISTSVAHEREETKLNIPDLGKSFDLACVDIPNLTTNPESVVIPVRTLNS